MNALQKISVSLLLLAFCSCNQADKNKKTEGTPDDLSKYQPKNYVEIKHPEWSKNATIYEVNVRQFTPEGTFKAFETHLPRLKAMGVDIIWLMPINPIGVEKRKGTLGSYYSVKDYYGVNPEFGTLEDLKALVKKIHGMGMYKASIIDNQEDVISSIVDNSQVYSQTKLKCSTFEEIIQFHENCLFGYFRCVEEGFI